MYWLYILYSRKLNKYYTGISSDPEARLISHNELGNEWTAKGRPWELMFKKKFPDRASAQKRERWIKKQKSREIIELIVIGEFDWRT